MTTDGTSARWHPLEFRQVVRLFPAVFALHVAEEWPRFVAWAQRFASPSYSRTEYLVAHLGGIALAIVIAGLVSRWPNRVVVFLFFALSFLPGMLFNTVFHVGATLHYHAYSPGTVTAVTLFLPFLTVVTRLAWREGRLGAAPTAAAVVIAAVFHAAEVGHDVFKAW
jgi:hypothetical protein